MLMVDFTNPTSTLITSVVFLLSYFLAKSLIFNGRKRNYPPAIPSVPILGSVPFLTDRTDLHKEFVRKAKQLGSVFSCYLGSRYTVVLNDRNSIREALLKRGSAFADRELPYVGNVYWPSENKGIAARRFETDPKHERQVFLKILKEFGLGKAELEDRMGIEIRVLIDRIKATQGAAFNPKDIVNQCVLGIVYRVAFGSRSTDSNSDVTYLQNKIANFLGHSLRMVNLLPIVRLLPKYRRNLKNSNRNWDDETRFIEEKIKECLEPGGSANETSFVEAFVRQEGPNYDRRNLTELCRNILNAGSETTMHTVLWTLKLLTKQPSLQKRIQEEIDAAIPSNRLPSLDDQQALPLTEATIMEVMRYKTLFPLSMMHGTTRDTEVAGFFIPKGTVVLPNLYAVHMSEEEWGDPEVFRPERFLNETGTVVEGRNRIMPFSLGRRSCIGERLARQELFVLISSLVQHFEIHPAYEEKKTGDHDYYVVTRIKPFDVRLLSRKASDGFE